LKLLKLKQGSEQQIEEQQSNIKTLIDKYNKLDSAGCAKLNF